MGRSRSILNSANDDPSRSRRKKAPVGEENVESVTQDEGTNDRKTALYHCNYCNKDISGMIRIKCVQCPDFDLCIECFSVGAEVFPHKSNHPYRVMDNLSFPLLCPDWNADEEILLLEGIAMYGVSNWAEVAEHVGTKIKSECIDHYDSVYIKSPCFPLPDMSHVIGKKREDLQAMAKEHNELQKSLEDASLKEYATKVKLEEQQKDASGSLSLQADASGTAGSSTVATGAAKKPFSAIGDKDHGAPIKSEAVLSDRKVGENKPKLDGGPSVTDLSGYNRKRHEFEIEYDNEAELILAEMEFNDTDTKAERELKLEVVRIYNRRLDERQRRKDFVIERNLLQPDPFEKNLSPEERQLCQKYRPFMRFHSKEDHEGLLKTVIEEHRLRRRLQNLQEAKAAGCRNSSEAARFLAQKGKREAQEKQCGPSSAEQPRVNSLDNWDVSSFPGADMLSETEKRLCTEIRLLPAQYLNMMQTMSMEVMKGNITKKPDAHRFFKIDSREVDKVYDMLVKKGLAP